MYTYALSDEKLSLKTLKVLRKFYEKTTKIMATFKAVVMRHQQRRDDKFPVSIRVTHNKKSAYISTGLYVSKRQINSKTFEIKDQFVLERTNETIRTYERHLLSYGSIELSEFPIDVIKRNLTSLSERINYFDFCNKIIEEKPKEHTIALRNSLKIIREEMGYSDMYATDFTSNFLRKFKQTLDTRDVTTKLKDGTVRKRKMSQKTKRGYLMAICSVFRRMKEHYNTEFVQKIAHDPFIGLEMYKEPVTKKRSMDVANLRTFLSATHKSRFKEMATDIMMMSFCLCGMNIADIYNMPRSAYEPKTKRITYNRLKTRNSRADCALSSIRVEPEMEHVFNKYYAKEGDRLFDFGSKASTYSFSHMMSHRVRSISVKLGMEMMSPYWFRHTWATIARNKCGISKDDIDMCLNHTGNNRMADVYIDYDWSIIDRANRKVLDYVFHSDKE